MEQLKYVVEDRTIAELLGVQNFLNKESAILELVKNAYDAKATVLEIFFEENKLSIIDNGVGMNSSDIKSHWMHVGKSGKEYEVTDSNKKKRILAGSKGIGRFALSRLGANVCMYSRKEGSLGPGIIWSTDWNNSLLEKNDSQEKFGTAIVITELRDIWSKNSILKLIEFLSKMYNDDAMEINICFLGEVFTLCKYFPQPLLGINCLSKISLDYDSNTKCLTTVIESDEFTDEAKKYYFKGNLYSHECLTDIMLELKKERKNELSEEELSSLLCQIGNFSSRMYFSISSSTEEQGKFLYKYRNLPNKFNSGVILYRNAFSISSYEGTRDWLGLDKRARKSPAAASHPTGAWKVRSNQLAGKVEIDKQNNSVLKDLSNRQGLEENIYFELFIDIILTGLKEFERYRQEIIRSINMKNQNDTKIKLTPLSDKILSKPTLVSEFSSQEAKQLALEIRAYKKEHSTFKKEKAAVEERYKYDVRILNVLATTGLKASSIAHEMRNDRNVVLDNCSYIVSALQEYNMWEELSSKEYTSKSYKNVPFLLETNRKINHKIVTFMDTMLEEIEKKQFESEVQNMKNLLEKVKSVWERDYQWINIAIDVEEELSFVTSVDMIHVICDNLILNSIQQNEDASQLNINILVREESEKLMFEYGDDGKGLDKKYLTNPRKILEVHESTRKKGHGLGMWIVNNTIVMSGGEILEISGTDHFSIKFLVGGKV